MSKKTRQGFKTLAPSTSKTRKTVPSQELKIKSWLSDKLALIIITSVGVLTYATGLGSPFWNDDLWQIVRNPLVHSLANIGIFFSEGTFYYPGSTLTLIGGFYRPMMTTVFSLIYVIFGLHTFAYHAVQLALGIASAVFLFKVFRYSFGTILSLLLALVFLVHPIDSQVLFAIPSMQDALYFFFGIFALWILLRFESRRSMIFASTSLFVAMLSKETGALFVLVCLLYLWLFDPKRLKNFALYLILPIIVYGLLYWHAHPYVMSPSGSAPVNVLGLGQRLLTAPSTTAFYLSKLIWPQKLATAYDWVVTGPTLTGFWLPVAIDALFLGALAGAGLLLARRVSRPVLKTYLFYSVWALSGLGLVSQLVPLDMTACETWFYFSMAGLLGAFGVVIQSFSKRFHRYHLLITASALLLIIALGTRTALRGVDWQDTTRIDYADIADSPDDFDAFDRLAQVLAKQGQYRASVKFEEVSIKLFPDNFNYGNLAITEVKMGHYQMAINDYKKALHYNFMKPTIDSAAGLAAVYDDPQDAYALINTGLSYYSNDYNLWMDMAIVSAKMHHLNDVHAALVQASRLGQVEQSMAAQMLSGQPFAARYEGRLIQFQ
jgi:tetratricopeptide (TPR) repeat protein